MTDKEMILETLNDIKYHNGHTNIIELWERPPFTSENGEPKYTEEQKRQVRIKLEENGFATPNIHDFWSLMITIVGFEIKPEDLNKDGNLKRNPVDKAWRKTIKTLAIGALIGFLPTFGLEFFKVTWPKEPAKIEIINDALYIKQDTLTLISPKNE